MLLCYQFLEKRRVELITDDLDNTDNRHLNIIGMIYMTYRVYN